MPVMDRLAEIMDEAYEANQAGDLETVRGKVREYLALFTKYVDTLK